MEEDMVLMVDIQAAVGLGMHREFAAQDSMLG